jgi:hypothetical protein
VSRRCPINPNAAGERKKVKDKKKQSETGSRQRSAPPACSRPRPLSPEAELAWERALEDIEIQDEVSRLERQLS